MKTASHSRGCELSARLDTWRNVIFAGYHNYGALAFRNKLIAALAAVEGGNAARNVPGLLTKCRVFRYLDYRLLCRR